MSAPILHATPPDMLSRAWKVVVVGAGGTGSALLPSLARLHHAMLELGHPGGIECVVFDDDTVSEFNVGRQGFYPNDVGQYKATLLVNRLNLLMGTNWRAAPQRVDPSTALRADIVIGCVDSRAARHAIVESARRGGCRYYLDCGNETDRGQVILGEFGKPRPDRLPHVGDLFPDMLNAKNDKGDDTPSCSMADALRKQSLVINQAIAVQAFNLLWSLFRNGGLTFSAVFVNLATGRTNPVPIDPAAWARFGYEVAPAKKAAKKPARRRKAA
ncbi:PRTRC genetic system ThiF family protein [Paraburkholderia tropica]|uniref:PRTRC genetic system ThiF family protein n=2 Tax=Paraburkholderia tropica TaxID=92647 RepID=A0ABX5MCB4_9BURK|nr:PRTRC system ThiF family protein [Paraburkholderia tropica]MBB2984203.1 PRTRC genetic system ThiF family protein [Paraburkholderia tropica]MBB3004078.1 PRTRC genetic system ThiF family protein [Paraburkholderia tropica]MBB6323235.1 PRTRC genetic system ThiF family protein [Paraburkholderia tropica]PXX05686.1 PRTRC genetic system ThiF family protein [Paraburkholderia tropica]PZW70808.1 PRTRC genetic system ThiF family protein [Paraburkholderia tropica]